MRRAVDHFGWSALGGEQLGRALGCDAGTAPGLPRRRLIGGGDGPVCRAWIGERPSAAATACRLNVGANTAGLFGGVISVGFGGKAHTRDLRGLRFARSTSPGEVGFKSGHRDRNSAAGTPRVATQLAGGGHCIAIGRRTVPFGSDPVRPSVANLPQTRPDRHLRARASVVCSACGTITK